MDKNSTDISLRVYGFIATNKRRNSENSTEISLRVYGFIATNKRRNSENNGKTLAFQMATMYNSE